MKFCSWSNSFRHFRRFCEPRFAYGIVHTPELHRDFLLFENPAAAPAGYRVRSHPYSLAVCASRKAHDTSRSRSLVEGTKHAAWGRRTSVGLQLTGVADGAILLIAGSGPHFGKFLNLIAHRAWRIDHAPVANPLLLPDVVFNGKNLKPAIGQRSGISLLPL
jgi:hypothetical protein